MQPEMIRQLQALQEQAERLSSLARGLSGAAPQQAEGVDATGQVTVVLDRSGRPVRIKVRDGWEQRLAAGRLGAAATDACAGAVAQAMRAWTQTLEQSRWQQQRNTFDHGRRHGTVGSVQSSPVPAGQPRDVSELAEIVMARLQTISQPSLPEPAPAQGSDAGGQVIVRLEPGGTLGCSIDERWATGRSGDAITEALQTALNRARTQLAGPRTPAADVDRLIGDVLTTLDNLKNQ